MTASTTITAPTATREPPPPPPTIDAVRRVTAAGRVDTLKARPGAKVRFVADAIPEGLEVSVSTHRYSTAQPDIPRGVHYGLKLSDLLAGIQFSCGAEDAYEIWIFLDRKLAPLGEMKLTLTVGSKGVPRTYLLAPPSEPETFAHYVWRIEITDE